MRRPPVVLLVAAAALLLSLQQVPAALAVDVPVPVAPATTSERPDAHSVELLAPVSNPRCGSAWLVGIGAAGQPQGAAADAALAVLCGGQVVAAGPEELSCTPDPILEGLLDQAGVPSPVGPHPVGDAVAQLYDVEDQLPPPADTLDLTRTAGGLLVCAPPYQDPPPAAPSAAPSSAAPAVPDSRDPEDMPVSGPVLPASGNPGPALNPQPISEPVTQAPEVAPPPAAALTPVSDGVQLGVRSGGLLLLILGLVFCALAAGGMHRLLCAPVLVSMHRSS